MKTIFRALEDGRSVPDHEFDLLFPEKIRDLSETHWTPIEIARRAAHLLVVDSRTRVLDVGSGCGKFCFVGAITTRGQFHGIEQRSGLARLSREIATSYEMNRVEFTEGDVRSVDWSSFHGFYLYNPFIEDFCTGDSKIAQYAGYSDRAYLELIGWVERQFQALPVGTRVVTYHGFGGEMPPEYRLLVQEPGGGDFLRLWVKVGEC